MITGGQINSLSHSSSQQRQNHSQGLQQFNTPWSSSKLMIKANNSSAKHTSSSTTAQRRKTMQRGYSQDIDSAHETLRRRTALLQLQDSSLSYDVDNKNELFFNQLSTKKNISTGSVVVAITPPRIPTPTVMPLPNFNHR